MQKLKADEVSSDEDEAFPLHVEHTPKRQMVLENQHYNGQIKVFDTYQSHPTQYFVAGIIVGNFLVQCYKRQYDPGCGWEEQILSQECANQPIWDAFSWFFNIAFLVELIWNLAGSWFKPFWTDTWNYFDCVVVGLGVLDMMQVNLGKLKLLRMVRAFRIFRLFGRVKSLKKIILSLVNAGAGVGNAFLIVFIVMCIFAVLAVDLFGSVMCGPDGKPLPAWEGTGFHGDMCFGIGYYGTFVTSLYTMFQILTGESWSEGCVWPMLDYFLVEGDKPSYYATMSFFTLFVVITNFILLNVVVTVLIDGMNQSVEVAEDPTEAHESEPHGRAAVTQMLEKLQASQAQNQKDLEDVLRAVAALPNSP
jgi:hypothetical protein